MTCQNSKADLEKLKEMGSSSKDPQPYRDMTQRLSPLAAPSQHSTGTSYMARRLRSNHTQQQIKPIPTV